MFFFIEFIFQVLVELYHFDQSSVDNFFVHYSGIKFSLSSFPLVLLSCLFKLLKLFDEFSGSSFNSVYLDSSR